MKFLALRSALEKAEHEKKINHPIAAIPAVTSREVPPEIRGYRIPEPLGPLGKVVGGAIIRQPIDRVAARVVAKAPDWAHPPPDPPKPASITKPSKPKKRKHMKNFTEDKIMTPDKKGVDEKTYTSQCGVRVTMVNGEPMFSADDVNRLVCEEVAKLPKETRPVVLAAQDARRVIDELLDGLGDEMRKFRQETNMGLEDIRQTRFAMVSEVTAMTGPLKDVRQFFLGSDYKDQIARLREFVDLCERLYKLKESGFLDKVADTILRLTP